MTLAISDPGNRLPRGPGSEWHHCPKTTTDGHSCRFFVDLDVGEVSERLDRRGSTKRTDVMVPGEYVPLHIKALQEPHGSVHHGGRRIALVEEVSELDDRFDTMITHGSFHHIADVADEIPTTAIEALFHRTSELGVVPDVKISEHTYLHGRLTTTMVMS